MPRVTIQDKYPGGAALEPLPCPMHELIEEALVRFAEWRLAAANAAERYARWCSATGGRDRHFDVYLAALDQEESAALMYAVVSSELRAYRDEVA
jgi:hypothetical protein